MDVHWHMVELLARRRAYAVGSEVDFALWHDECFGVGWTMQAEVS